ncbi:hypothetical protein FQR65_LT05995 [Abscondita terminalis]|nr:hypothetical protein FQR65_LT05995 [Abscondita terminalis]
MTYAQKCFFENFIKEIIQKQLKIDVNITNIDNNDYLQNGENYLSELQQIVVKYTENNSNVLQSMSLIAKIPLQKNSKFEEQVNFFGREIAFYANVLPLLNKLEHSKKVAPDFYYLSNQPKKLLVLEDLSVLNYKTCKRQEGLDLEHCLLTIDKLAYFHAASLAVYEKNPEIIDNCPLFHKTNLYGPIAEISFQETIKVCQREPHLQKYADKISRELLNKYFQSRNPDAKFNVFNHGDFWCNNLMFQYNDEGILNDVLFVDFQVCLFASPFYDLHFFLASTPNLEVKKNHTTFILKHYYDALCKYADVFNLKTRIPTREEFDDEFRSKSYIEVVNKIAPYPYYLSMQPKQMLVLEDLSALNYKMCNRQKGLDLNHCLLTIKKLAYLHAASLAIYEENPEVISTCRNFQKTSLYNSFFEVSFQETIKACRREPSLQKFVKNIKREFLEKYVTARKPDPNLNVLIHSDFWCNNFLFRYNDDESLNDVLFVDFQINIFASPFYDLHFFLASSPNLEVKKMHTSTILNCYYEAFTNYANDLNVRTKIPNRNEFHKEFRDKAYIGKYTELCRINRSSHIVVEDHHLYLSYLH